MNRSTVAVGKANAKVIMVGEHFVVSGSPAVAIPLIQLSTEVRLSPSEKVVCDIDASARRFGFNDGSRELMEKSLRFSANRFHWDLNEKPLSAVSTSNFPASRGLGSSASYSVALTRAFSALAGTRADIRAESQQVENLFHGKSSGLDTSTIASDASILYQNGEILKTFRPEAVDVVVADSGPRDTAVALVSRTMELRKNKPDLWNSLSGQIAELANACVAELEKAGGALEVARIIRNAQEVLSRIGLMNEQLSGLLELGQRAGALAGKLSGAGAGGVALFVCRRGEGPELARRMAQAGARVVTVA